MKQRGRKSQSALSTVTQVAAIPRTPPPADLGAFETEVWVSVVNTKPADWFQADTLPMLRAYCRHTLQAAKIDSEMDELIGKSFAADDGINAVKFEGLSRMRDRESRAIMALARSMRLTQQSQVHPEKAGTTARKQSGNRPWADK